MEKAVISSEKIDLDYDEEADMLYICSGNADKRDASKSFLVEVQISLIVCKEFPDNASKVSIS